MSQELVDKLEKRVKELEQGKLQALANANILIGQHAEATQALELTKQSLTVASNVECMAANVPCGTSEVVAEA